MKQLTYQASFKMSADEFVLEKHGGQNGKSRKRQGDAQSGNGPLHLLALVADITDFLEERDQSNDRKDGGAPPLSVAACVFGIRHVGYVMRGRSNVYLVRSSLLVFLWECWDESAEDRERKGSRKRSKTQ